MSDRSTVISRYEAKYVIPESLALRIRDAIGITCSPDKHAGPDNRYMVNNLYLDTPDLRFYYDTRLKRFTRFKPRVRYYGACPNDFLWVELKHKVKNVTWKIRRRINLHEWPHNLTDYVPNGNNGHLYSLADSFEAAVLRMQAQPVVHVQYIREPYVSELEEYCRITFDRCLTYRPACGSYALTASDAMAYWDDPITTAFCGDDSPVILEIKTETNVPFWVIALIRRFGLQQRGFSKYCNAMDNILGAYDYCDRLCAVR
ncbi:MAG TPA: polyphosphate polymerase domain-containing protein [bacterium]|nr:polyphosphate polymerase domain-containing protein [bacterium]